MFYSPYLRCPACRILVFDPALQLAAVDKPAPCCGSHGNSREIWPGFQAQQFCRGLRWKCCLTEQVAAPTSKLIAAALRS
jgi:hypothetical protein